MALNDIVFVKGQGGLGRPLPGEDFISGMIFYCANGSLPGGFATNDRIKLLNSTSDAIDLFIYPNFEDATSAISNIECTSIGSAGDKFTLSVSIIDELGNPATYVLANFTQTTEATTDDIAISVAALINGNSYTTGFTANVNTNQIDIVAPKRLGSYINGTSPTYSISGGSSMTWAINSNFVGGVNSNTAVSYYHISEFFRIQPKGQLYVMFADINTYGTFNELQTIQDFSNGKIRQCGIYFTGVFDDNNLTTIQSVCNTLATLHKPLSVLFASDITSFTALNTLPDLSQLNCPNVSAVIGQDGGGRGNYLYILYGVSISCVGATLGAVALSKVSDDIAWVGKYNISNGLECDTLAFGNGQKISAVSQNTLNLLDDRRFIFLIKYVGIAGSFFNDSHCAIALNSDYAYIENNRTIDKAIRGVYSSMLPNLNSPLQLNADGTLQDTTIAYFESQAAVNLEQMVRDSELSAFDVIINPVQPILQTGVLVVAIKLVPIGVAREIQVNIGFTLSI